MLLSLLQLLQEYPPETPDKDSGAILIVLFILMLICALFGDPTNNKRH